MSHPLDLADLIHVENKKKEFVIRLIVQQCLNFINDFINRYEKAKLLKIYNNKQIANSSQSDLSDSQLKTNMFPKMMPDLDHIDEIL